METGDDRFDIKAMVKVIGHRDPWWLKHDRYARHAFNRESFFGLLAIGSLALLLECLAYLKFAPASILASRLWLISGLACLAAILFLFTRLMSQDFKERNWLALLFPFLMAALLGMAISDPARNVIGQDATQQLAAGLQSYEKPDWNYTGTAFLGYPNRQYILAALPSLLFGRSEASLRLGFALPFYAGLMLFWVGLRRWSRGLRYGELAAMAATAAILAFPYVTEYYLYSEQTLFPACFALQVIGWLLLWLRRPSLLVLLALAWSGTMLIHCYTPALAGVGLLLMLLVAIGWDQLLHRQIGTNKVWSGSAMLAVAVLICSYLVLSLTSGRSDRATQLLSQDPAVLLAAAKTGLLVALTNRPVAFAGLLLPLVLVYLAGSLTGLFRWLHAAIASWVLAVIVLSQVLHGYAIYPLQITFSRTLITVPVICTACFLLVCGRLKPRIEPARAIPNADGNGMDGAARKDQDPASTGGELRSSLRRDWRNRLLPISLAAVCIVCLSVGTIQLFRPVVQGEAVKYLNDKWLNPMRLLVHDLNQAAAMAGYAPDDRFDLVICTDIVWLKNPRDYTQYFFPHAQITVLGRQDPLAGQTSFDQGGLIYLVDVYRGDLNRDDLNRDDLNRDDLNRDDLIDPDRIITRTTERRDMRNSVFEFERIIFR